ncbi:flavin monoamine oxidase family protein [Candidatus Raskinella chloraquaticus]|uniref:Amine oxidase n=1 Tax=Candidatus Raskinella chloraquaticus TaxID=1951219 RepID=A0A1W9HWF8_9HYPH|nr:MAG: amine oxidase [Proteobacteria bacterium SG_bin8]
MQTDILIIGAGLAGMALANRLHREHRRVLLVEARERFGGRIHVHEEGGAAFDLGPAWFWPGQPRMEALIADLGLTAFEQYCRGDLVYEHHDGVVERGRGFSSMQGSLRVAGGMSSLITGLARTLPAKRILTSTRLAGLDDHGKTVRAKVMQGADHLTIEAHQVVLAMPPRLAVNHISFDPPLAPAIRQAANDVPTWMAGQAKILAIYDAPHWRDAGLSGDAMSQRGPMVEIHDASPASGGPYALFGFVGVPPAIRQAHRHEVLRLAASQLVRLFGAALGEPRALIMQDWADEPLTATLADHAGPTQHPAYGRPSALDHLWQGRLHFASSEMAPHFGGYLEGALEAADTLDLARIA